MKRVLAILTIAAVFAACNGDQTSKTAALVDTTAIKQRAVAEEQARLKAQREEADRVAAAQRRSNAARRSTSPTVYSQPAVGSSANPVTTGSGSAVQQKQGMSSRTKGALIGAGAGAIAGGIIGHNIKGALIGGAVGAGTGYIIGRKKDKNAGRLPNN
jgi:hypothetical protein